MTQVTECGSRIVMLTCSFRPSQHRSASPSAGYRRIPADTGADLRAHDSYPLEDRSVRSQWISHSS
jgi:hypothetical protein